MKILRQVVAAGAQTVGALEPDRPHRRVQAQSAADGVAHVVERGRIVPERGRQPPRLDAAPIDPDVADVDEDDAAQRPQEAEAELTVASSETSPPPFGSVPLSTPLIEFSW